MAGLQHKRGFSTGSSACHQSGEPYAARCQMNDAQEVASRLVITRGDGPALFELGKEVFDQMAGLVKMRGVVPSRLLAAA